MSKLFEEITNKIIAVRNEKLEIIENCKTKLYEIEENVLDLQVYRGLNKDIPENIRIDMRDKYRACYKEAKICKQNMRNAKKYMKNRRVINSLLIRIIKVQVPE